MNDITRSLRLPAVKTAFGFSSDGAVYNGVNAGVITQPIKIGPRASAWPADEIRTLVIARTGGATEGQLCTLVNKLHEQRAKRWAALKSELLVA